MAVTTTADSGFPSLVNWAKRLSPSQGVADVINVLSKKMPLLDDIPWMESNMPTGHRITQAVNALPSPSWRKLNSGLSAVKGQTDQFDEAMGILQAESRVDVDLAKLGGNAAAYRASEDKLFIESLGQSASTALIYESVQSNPERIHGLTPRFPATTGYTASSYVLKAGTCSGVDGHSIWLINWEPRKLYGIFPKGSMAGLSVEDKGEILVNDPNDSTKQLWVYATKFQWKLGLAVEDYRYAVRIQWDTSEAEYTASAGKLKIAMSNALETIYSRDGNLRFYMDRTTKRQLNAELDASQNGNFLTYLDQGGKLVESFMGVPIRVSDSLTAETCIS
jgi:hypothetical protein